MKKSKPKVTKPGTVEKTIKSPYEPEKADIAIDGADPLYREIRIENTLEDENGKKVNLRKGAQVGVTLEADADETLPGSKSEKQSFEEGVRLTFLYALHFNTLLIDLQWGRAYPSRHLSETAYSL